LYSSYNNFPKKFQKTIVCGWRLRISHWTHKDSFSSKKFYWKTLTGLRKKLVIGTPSNFGPGTRNTAEQLEKEET